jgi:hypothetical protein
MRTQSQRRQAIALVIVTHLFLVALASEAGADALPDYCAGRNRACNNAPPNASQPGICLDAPCTRGGPGPDGGTITIHFTCLRCIATADAGGNGGNGGTGGNGGNGGTTSVPDGGSVAGAGAEGGSGGGDSGDGGCSCRLTDRAQERGLAALMLVTGALALKRARYRRRT